MSGDRDGVLFDDASTSAGIGVSGTSSPSPYTEADHQQVAIVIAELARLQKSRAWLARAVRTSNSTVSQVLAGKYVSPPTELLARMVQALSVETERMGDGTPGYIEGSVHKLVFVVCDRTRKHANFGVLVGNVGVGKTRTLREYAQRKPATLMIEANPHMTSGSLLVELLEQLHSPVPSGLDRKFQSVVKALKGTMHLLIVDEAENLSGNALHYLRRVRDKAEVGIVLAGTERLNVLLKPEHGQFDQIRSRVSMWPKKIESITRDDMDDIARATLRDAAGQPIDLTDEVLDTIWAYCKGSARVLAESLVPALRDYGINQGHTLSAGLIDKVARSVLFMSKGDGK